MVQSLFETKTLTFGEIMGNGRTYKTPRHQRDYSWKAEQWEDLWNDILALKQDPNDVHYMGAIVLQIDGNNSFLIIDGQQRLATISILIIAAITYLRELIEQQQDVEENNKRIDLFKKYLIDVSISSLKPANKLCLNDANNSFYKDTLLSFKDPINLHRQPLSNKLMLKAYEHFRKKLQQLSLNGLELGKFFEVTIFSKLIFMQITVEDAISAYTVFETLNARGTQLTPADLLKNYLLSFVTASSDMQSMIEQWQRISHIIDISDFPIFLRHYLNSKSESLVRTKDLFKTIKKLYHNKHEIFDLMDELEKAAGIYAALSDPNDQLWIDHSHGLECTKNIKVLNLFRITQHKSLLLAAYPKLKPEEFIKLLKDIVVISFRYLIIGGKNPNDLETAYHHAASLIAAGKIATAKKVFNEIKSVYVPDKEFESIFAISSFESAQEKKISRYILFTIEQLLTKKECDFESTKITIEHILPVNPTEAWSQSFSAKDWDNYIYRLGNYTLLNPRQNYKCGTQSFEDKRKIYEKSEYKLTQELNAFENWNVSSVNKRQEELAKHALAIWKINYADLL